jgi:alpha-ketoglutarate-dependent taurine dioxygenase
MTEYILTAVGRTGRHIDGIFQPAPFAYSLYHTVSVPLNGNTVFAPLNEIVQNLPSAKRNELERLWVMSFRRTGLIHSLIYPHPITRKKMKF